MARRRERPKKKTDEEKLETSFNHFKIPDGTFKDGCHILGIDPGKRNLGWAIFKIEADEAVYVTSGTLKVRGEPRAENECFLHINEFLTELTDKYDPLIFCWERAIGNGFALAREALGEVQGLIKLAGYRNNKEVIMKPVTTTCMETILLGSAGRDRSDKKTATSDKVKSFFPEELKDRKITKGGSFTHEADAIGCLYGLFKANGMNIKGVKNEREATDTDNNEMH